MDEEAPTLPRQATPYLKNEEEFMDKGVGSSSSLCPLLILVSAAGGIAKTNAVETMATATPRTRWIARTERRQRFEDPQGRGYGRGLH